MGPDLRRARAARAQGALSAREHDRRVSRASRACRRQELATHVVHALQRELSSAMRAAASCPGRRGAVGLAPRRAAQVCSDAVPGVSGSRGEAVDAECSEDWKIAVCEETARCHKAEAATDSDVLTEVGDRGLDLGDLPLETGEQL